MSDDPRGYIQLHRKIQDNWLWGLMPFDERSAFIDLLILANWKPRQVKTRYGIVNLKRGEVMASYRFLMERWGWGVGRVIRYTDLLIAERMAERRVESRQTIISIQNYDQYQSAGAQTGTSAELQRNFSGTSAEQLNTLETLEPLKTLKTERDADQITYPELLRKLKQEDPPTISTALAVIKAAHASFDTVNDFHITNALESHPDQSAWVSAIEKLASTFAGAELSLPVAALRKYLAEFESESRWC